MYQLSTVLAIFLCSIVFCSELRAQTPPPTVTTEEFEKAIRANDLELIKTLAARPDAVNVSSKLHSTALHYAARFGSAQAVSLLLAAGANPNVKNDQGVTPLFNAAYNFEKTRLLVEKGADVNAAANPGTTPLMIAASVHGNAKTVRYLIEKGAQVTAVEKSGGDALIRSAGSEVEVTELLLKKGADPKRADAGGVTALLGAAGFAADREQVALLLAAGADPNAANTFSGKVKNGPIALTHLTPLMLAVPYGGIGTVKMLLKGGARVNDADVRKMTPLMLAVAVDQASPEVVHELIAAGADVNAKDQNGESVLDWARKFRQPAVLSALNQAGARGREPSTAAERPRNSPAGTASEAVARALPLLASSGPQFFREGGGCNGCHHQPMYARTFAAVASAGGSPDVGLRQGVRDSLMADRPRILTFSTFLIDTGGLYDPPLLQLEALGELHEPPSLVTDSMVHYIAVLQSPSGAWTNFGGARPPIEGSDISRTASAILALRAYGWPARREEFDERISRARAWLQKAQPVTSYEHADRIKGLRAAGVAISELRPDVEELLKQQRADGGWAQTPYLDSDAYATGLVLRTLGVNGFLTPADAAYRKGTAFLLSTQYPDGSWYVKSRAPKFQPYFQSGFPFDHDQWISSTATAWAAMALAPAMQTTPSAGSPVGSPGR